MIELKIICKIVNKIENLKKKFINEILFTPKFQKIISSFSISYFVIIYKKLIKNINGRTLVIIFGKINNVNLIYIK
tara:strand:+ start:324 stop:551 length:228 start_codon:yes stop_codon:yes gene_type:complete